MKKQILWKACVYEFDDFRELSEDDEQEDFDEEFDIENINLVPVTRMMNTPAGLYHVDDSLNPFRDHEFRKGCTNFDITPSVMEFIEKCEGVESLIVLSRYTFIIGIGMLFDFRDVRVRLEQELCEDKTEKSEDNEHPKIKEIKDLAKRESLNNNTKYWCALIFPNGKSEIFHSNNLEEYNEKLDFYNKSQKAIDGVVLSHDK